MMHRITDRCISEMIDGSDNRSLRSFEISTRIVTGTNPHTSGSPYSDLIYPEMSKGRRIAVGIKRTRDMECLLEVLA
jgi:5-formaminoimidazole-4-carboxamide-1-(beta)-D-ribofuranosyl 5'-monophosphate synthetase